jgi:hypothetical protein
MSSVPPITPTSISSLALFASLQPYLNVQKRLLTALKLTEEGILQASLAQNAFVVELNNEQKRLVCEFLAVDFLHCCAIDQILDKLEFHYNLFNTQSLKVALISEKRSDQLENIKLSENHQALSLSYLYDLQQNCAVCRLSLSNFPTLRSSCGCSSIHQHCSIAIRNLFPATNPITEHHLHTDSCRFSKR